MTPARWHQIENLYFSVVERPAHERTDFLRDSANDDSDLRREVESLIAAHERADDFLPESELFAIGCELLAERSRALRRGQRFGSYKILNFIGSGGMGEVYHAADERSDRCVALKLLPRSFSQDPERVARFRREARAASRVVHENIARIYDVGTFENLDFIALEYIEGKTLRQRLKNGALSETEVLIFAEQIAKALAAAHAAGIVHRDLKPENIMITSDGQVKIVDFSIAKFERKSSARKNSRETDFDLNETNPLETAAEKIVGTPGYMSPEQLRGHEIDNRTDIWNFGVLLYEMLIGKPPFRGVTNVDVIAAVLTVEPAFSDESKISSDLCRIIRKSLSKEPARRYRTADEMLDALKHLSAQNRTTGGIEKTAHWKFFAVAAVFAVFVLGGIRLSEFEIFSRTVSQQEIEQTVCTEANGLISWYAAEGNADNNFGFDNGFLENGAGYAPAKIGYGFNFDGADDFFRAPAKSLPIGDNDRTIEAWVKINSFDTELYSESFFVGYGDFGKKTQTFHLTTHDYENYGTSFIFSQWGEGITGPKLKAGIFYHIAVTNIGNSVRLYLNGALVNSGDLTINTPADTELFFGRIPGTRGNTRKLNGIVDEVKIYNRALNAEEIQAIYNNGSGIECK